MSVHDAVVEYRVGLVRLIEGSSNRRRACREAGIHHSTFYRWRRVLLRQGRDGLIPQPQRRVPPGRMRLESAVVAVSLAHPNLGPQRVADELEVVMGIVLSPSTVWRILVAHRLNTRGDRWRLLGGTPAPLAARAPWQKTPGRLDAEVPGDLVQMDCFHVGSLKETRLGAGKTQRGVIWQYTAIDVASSFLWAELHTSAHNPDPARTTALAYRVATDLRAWGWRPRAVSTDNGNEFRARPFTEQLDTAGIRHRYIRPGRPQSNGKVERVQRTLLEEFYQPAFAAYTEPSITGLRRDLDDYLTYYNWQRPHHGRWNQGQTPAAIIKPTTKNTPPT